MSQCKVVLDTNVLVSALINDEGFEAKALKLVSSEQIQLCVSDVVLAEYQKVLYRPKLKLNPQLVKSLLIFCQFKTIVVSPTLSVFASPHEPDNRFLECAEAAEADYLVTGNKRHFPDGWKDTEIVNARELLDRLNLP